MPNRSIKDKEKDFLEPAFQYFVENGLENTSVRNLCKYMKISLGSLYYWFDDKEDIYISIVRYGIDKVTGELFEEAFEKTQSPATFFDAFWENVKKHREELKLIFQFLTGPEYGKKGRAQAENFKSTYEKYVVQLADATGFTEEEARPIVYMLISMVVDYSVWDDMEASQMQLQFLKNIVTQMK